MNFLQQAVHKNTLFRLLKGNKKAPNQIRGFQKTVVCIIRLLYLLQVFLLFYQPPLLPFSLMQRNDVFSWPEL
jgi:hypothetical protein